MSTPVRRADVAIVDASVDDIRSWILLLAGGQESTSNGHGATACSHRESS